MTTLQVVGAGLPRTGTNSLKAALERLLGGPCYHMLEVFEHLDHAPMWRRALAGDATGWQEAIQGYVAAVDWPESAIWQQVAEANPAAQVLLSTRKDAETWWSSVDATIMRVLRGDAGETDPEWNAMARELFEQTGLRDGDPEGSMAAYERHNAEVRASVPPERLVEWHPGDGWEPLCSALDLPVPDEPFPHLNTREDWIKRAADAPGR
jgi:8-oxo-dGTP pyrophosphatase MutT (NUDIX family)